MDRGKTLYLWDLAWTLFPEKWNKEKSGFGSFDEYVESLGFDLKNISPRDYEWAYEKPYKEGMFDLDIAKGFRETLSFTKNNAVFTTGNKEQVEWRAAQINPKVGFDIRNYIGEIHSTFDYGDRHIKTKEMLQDILKKKFAAGCEIVVYTDDKIENIQFFLEAAKAYKVRCYHMKNDDQGLREKGGYYEAGSLFDVMEMEKKIREN